MCRLLAVIALIICAVFAISACGDKEEAGAEKYGYIDTNGKCAIPCKYAEAFHFHDGLAAVRLPGQVLFGYIDKQGRQVIAPISKRASTFSEGLIAVHDGKRSGFIDKSGRMVFSLNFETAGPFSEGLAVIGRRANAKEPGDLLFGFIDHDGKLVIDCRYVGTGSFHEGLCPVYEGKSKRWGYINRKGSFEIEPKYLVGGNFSDDGLAAVKIEAKKWGFIDKCGRLAIPAKFRLARPFGEHVACVETQDGKRALINSRGEILVDEIVSRAFHLPQRFSSDRAMVLGYGKEWSVADRGFPAVHGFIDKRGTFVIPVVFSFADDFSEGLACVSCKQ